jgi:hypothetical protein
MQEQNIISTKSTEIDKYGYQVINITEDLINITFPNGDNIKSPTFAILEAIQIHFKEK